jgi:hypothetical protein
MGGCAGRGPTCISQGTVNLDAGTSNRQQTPTPGPVGVNTAGGSVKLQDVYIKIRGYGNIQQSGQPILPTDDEVVAFKAKVNTDDYLKRRKPIEFIGFRGGEGAKNPSDQIIQQVKFLESTKGPLGSILITGGSAGGKNALEVASKLTAQGVRYVGIADGAFQKDDILIENPLTFKAPKIMCMEKVNWYQSWGHTLDPKQELHGRVDDRSNSTFANIDLTDFQGVKDVRKEYEKIIWKRGKDKQEALEKAHVLAYQEAFTQAEKRILEILRTN